MAMPSSVQPAIADAASQHQQQQKVQLLSTWASPFSLRVELALTFKGIPYHKIPQNLQDKSPLLLQYNPIHKKIPVLLHGHKAISESSIIVQYIDETWPHPHHNLLPSDPYHRAIHRFWADYIDKKLLEALFTIMRTKGEAQKAAVEETIKCFATVDDALGKVGGGPLFGGEKLGFADIVLGPFLAWRTAFEAVADTKFPLEEEFPRLHDWMEEFRRCQASSVLPEPDKVSEFAMIVRKRFVS